MGSFRVDTTMSGAKCYGYLRTTAPARQTAPPTGVPPDPRRTEADAAGTDRRAVRILRTAARDRLATAMPGATSHVAYVDRQARGRATPRIHAAAKNKGDSCRQYALPRLRTAGWDIEPHSFTEQDRFTDGWSVIVGTPPCPCPILRQCRRIGRMNDDATARFARAYWRAFRELDSLRLRQWEQYRLTLPQLREIGRAHV